MEEIPKEGKISSNRKSRITRQQFKDRRAHFEKGSSTAMGNPECVRSSKPRRVFSHITEDAEDDVRLSSDFEEIEKTNTRKVSENSKLLLIGATKDIKSKYVDLALFRQPVCLVQNDENSKLSIEKQIMNEIATIDDPVNVIAIAGPYRSGKSYLLNRLANAQRVFSSLAEQYIESIQSGELPCIDDALTIMSKEENTIAVKKAVDVFKDKIESIELPLPDDFDLRYTQAQRESLKYFRNMSVLDDNQTFQKKAESEMDIIKSTVEVKNRAFIKDLCSKEFQSMYTTLIKPKINNGTYAKSGGYKLYRDDFVRLRENVQQRLPRVDSNLIQISALDFEGKYRKQDEEISEKAYMSESQIKMEMEEQHEKRKQEKADLEQKIELKNTEKLERFKKELFAQREKELQELKEKFEKMIQDW